MTAPRRQPLRAAATPPRPCHRARPALKGQSLPKPKTLPANPSVQWRRITVSAWCGHKEHKALEITSDTALWYRRGAPPTPIRWVLVRDPDGRRDPQAFFSTNTALDPAEIIALFVRRWRIEVTFAEFRAHLGIETQRQWSDRAIARTTPALLGLYSLIALWACDLIGPASTPHDAAWYRKQPLTFTDAIGAVRFALWADDTYRHSPTNRESPEIPPDRLKRMAEALCFAA